MSITSVTGWSSHLKALEGDGRVKNFAPFRGTINHLSSAVGRKVVLAGGCIRDMWIQGSDLIKDYDAWVLGVQPSEVPQLDNQLSNMPRESEDMYLSRPIEAAGYPTGDFHVPKFDLYFSWVPDNKPVQVMYTQAETMEELVIKFDWHACSFGFDGRTVISSGVKDFEAKTLTLNPENALRSARSTLRRGFRLEDKFRGTAHQLRMHNDTILALAAMLILSGEKHKA